MAVVNGSDDPPFSAQVLMYAGSFALLALLIVEFLAAYGSKRDKQQVALPQQQASNFTSIALGVTKCSARLAFHCACFGILTEIVLTANSSVPFPLAMWCVVALTSTFFLEYAVLDLFALVGHYRMKPDPEASSSSQDYQVQTTFTHAIQSNWQVVDAISNERSLAGTEFFALQVPPMLCVLLLGLALRTIQRSTTYSNTAMVGMCFSTGVAVLQAVIVGYARAQIQLGYAQDKAEVGPFLQLGIIFRSLSLVCLYAGIGLILAGIVAIDRTPEAHQLSATMQCLMMLNVTYFVVHFAVVGGTACCRFIHRWSSSAIDGLQNSLAFAPMLCVLMIGVRLRAIQLDVQDPPSWATQAMWTASISVVAKVLCSTATHRESREDGASSSDDEAAIASSWKHRSPGEKLTAIVLLAITLLATFFFYIAVSVLIVAVFLMESERAAD
jgi:hypothetical protein